MRPLVTIMIPTYGQADVILAAVDSALAQDYPNLEVVVADDASPDHTAEIVATRKDTRLRYHRNSRNLGRVANYRNTLYTFAAGEWVVCLDGDDFFTDPLFISAAMEIAYREDGIVIVAARQDVNTPTGTHKPLPLRTMILPGAESLLRYADSRYHFSHLATLYHRPSALAGDFYRMDVSSSDWESLLRLAVTGKVAYLDRIVGCWNLHGSNASLTNSWQDLVANLAIWEPVYRAAEGKVSQMKLEWARFATLKLLAMRDLSLIFTGGAAVDAFRYIYYGAPVLKPAVVAAILLHPYIWLKLSHYEYKRLVRRIAC